MTELSNIIDDDLSVALAESAVFYPGHSVRPRQIMLPPIRSCVSWSSGSDPGHSFRPHQIILPPIRSCVSWSSGSDSGHSFRPRLIILPPIRSSVSWSCHPRASSIFPAIEASVSLSRSGVRGSRVALQDRLTLPTMVHLLPFPLSWRAHIHRSHLRCSWWSEWMTSLVTSQRFLVPGPSSERPTVDDPLGDGRFLPGPIKQDSPYDSSPAHAVDSSGRSSASTFGWRSAKRRTTLTPCSTQMDPRIPMTALNEPARSSGRSSPKTSGCQAPCEVAWVD
jgi:hypothetical protein